MGALPWILGGLTLAGAAAAAEPPGPPKDDPVAVVRAFYAHDSIRAYEFYSARLKGLFLEDARLAGGEVGNLTFAFHVNAQDVEDGWERTLRVDLVKRDKRRAEVVASFHNFGPQEIRFTLVREKDRWLIDDARSVRGHTWVLSEILTGG